MLKKSIKNNYLIFLIVITFVFVSCFLSAFIPSSFADEKKCPKEKTATLSESSKLQEKKLSDVSDPLKVLENITSSLTTKTNLATSKIVYDMRAHLKTKYKESSKYINLFVDTLRDYILVVEDWEDVQVTNFKKETFDIDSFKDIVKTQLKFIFEQSHTSIQDNVDSSCSFLWDEMEVFSQNAIISTVNALWP
ncbi:hypothetical protein M33023_02150 [Candidatus Phytoplasma asteris]|uniref:Effector n=1 Tax=Candidatus Phytoplasma asteris TaxID=85620 RepID=A0ABZ2YFX5_9MOLU